MTELTSWAESGTPREATAEEIDGGFECGPADRYLFDWLIQELVKKTNLMFQIGFYQSAEAVQNTPPASPTAGQSWVVGSAPTDAWVGNEDKIAIWTGSAWAYVTPKPKMLVGIKDGPDVRWRDDLTTPAWMNEISSVAYRSMI